MSVENLLKKWAPVLDHSELPGIQGSHKRSVTAQLLENQEIACRQDAHGSGGYRNQTSLLSTLLMSSSTVRLGSFSAILKSALCKLPCLK